MQVFCPTTSNEAGLKGTFAAGDRWALREGDVMPPELPQELPPRRAVDYKRELELGAPVKLPAQARMVWRMAGRGRRRPLWRLPLRQGRALSGALGILTFFLSF